MSENFFIRNPKSKIFEKVHFLFETHRKNVFDFYFTTQKRLRRTQCPAGLYLVMFDNFLLTLLLTKILRVDL